VRYVKADGSLPDESDLVSENPMPLGMNSAACASGGAIPALDACEGQDVSPPLAWTGLTPAMRRHVLKRATLVDTCRKRS
jgi:hypothetical protein